VKGSKIKADTPGTKILRRRGGRTGRSGGDRKKLPSVARNVRRKGKENSENGYESGPKTEEGEKKMSFVWRTSVVTEAEPSRVQFHNALKRKPRERTMDSQVEVALSRSSSSKTMTDRVLERMRGRRGYATCQRKVRRKCSTPPRKRTEMGVRLRAAQQSLDTIFY